MSELSLPRLPELYSIPQQAVNEWVALPESHEFHPILTKGTLDHLFFSIDKSVSAQAALQQCLINYSKGDTDQANVALVEAQSLIIDAQNRLRHFMTDMILSVTRR